MPAAIRSAAVNDVPAILAIEQQAPTASHWSPEQYERLLETGVVLIAEIATRIGAPHPAGKPDEPCGFVCANAIAGVWEIQNLVVAREFLRRGVASELLRELIVRAETAATSAILLEVRESNLPARRLYEKHGFQQVGSRRVYYDDPPEDAILYTLRLDR